MQSESTCRPGSAEFPHDNPQIDTGALWPEGALEFTVGEAEAAEEPTTVTPTDTSSESASTLTSTTEASEDPVAVFVHAVTEGGLGHGDCTAGGPIACTIPSG